MKGLSQLVGRRDWMSDVRMKLLVGPLLILMILGMMIVPLPPLLWIYSSPSISRWPLWC
ncbi:hypothetical protein HORIV_01480 [Vreelandella olivaria]|uniref:Uncharacterized protein n=1 Tax=Vreelandella olivaria TaxID=390919 RepID=A0ABN5WL90_9GAMM|nr:hypothetical protein HORIV_01480 [Halomonas olivaria]